MVSELLTLQWKPIAPDRLPKSGQLVAAWDREDIHIATYRPESLYYRWDCDVHGLGPDSIKMWIPINPPKLANTLPKPLASKLDELEPHK